MPADITIRLDDRRSVTVSAPQGTLVLEVVAAVTTAGGLGDGPYWLVRGGQSLQPHETISPSTAPIVLEPAHLLKGKLDALPRESVQVGSISVRFSGSSGPAGPSPVQSGRPDDDFDIRIVNSKGGAPPPAPGPRPGVTIDPATVSPRSGVHCVGCGGGISAMETTCRACGTKVRGALLSEEVPFAEGSNLSLPRICCCCLRQAERVETEKKLAEMRGNVRTYLTVPMPWCNDCWSTHTWSERMGAFFAIVAIAAGIGAGFLLDKAGMNGWVIFLGGLAVTVGIIFLAGFLEKSRTGYNKPGHVAVCRGYVGIKSDFAQPPSFSLVFGNRQFARQWQAMNPR